MQDAPDGITEQLVAPVLDWSVHVHAANLVFWFKTNNIKADKTYAGRIKHMPAENTMEQLRRGLFSNGRMRAATVT